MNKSTKQKKHILNVEDLRDSHGLWLRSYSKSDEMFQYQYHTRAGKLWASVNDRCKEDANLQQRYINYDSKNLFEDFQSFAEWCQNQEGYTNKNPNGTVWHLDKDLKLPGNKDYGPDVCIFIPARLNSLFSSAERTRGELPLGVCYNQDHERYVAMCSDPETTKRHIGYYSNPFEAHKAWQSKKLAIIKKEIIGVGKDITEEIRRALQCKIDMLEYDLLNCIETTSFRGGKFTIVQIN